MSKWRITKPYIVGVCDVTHETDCPLEAAYAFVRGWRVELVGGDE
jgi:hypothetical protein